MYYSIGYSIQQSISITVGTSVVLQYSIYDITGLYWRIYCNIYYIIYSYVYARVDCSI